MGGKEDALRCCQRRALATVSGCTRSVAAVAAKELANPLAVEAGDVLTLDLLGAFSLAGVGVGAGAEAELVHFHDHLPDAVGSLDFALREQGKVADLGADKEHGRSILASSHTGSAADTGGGIHGLVGLVFGNGDGVGIGYTAGGGADITTSLNNLVESGAVHHKVADDGEGLGTPRFNPDLIAIMELAHVELAGGDTIVVAVGTAIDVEAAHTADTFTAVVVETDGMCYAVVDELLIEDVEHLKERAFRRNVIEMVGLEMAFGAGIFLTPDM